MKGKSIERDNRNKSPGSSKVNSKQGYWHLAASFSSLVKITIIDGTVTEATESDSDVHIFKGEDSETDKEPTSDDVGLNCINQTSSTHLSVVICVSYQLKRTIGEKCFLPHVHQNWRKEL